MTKPIIVVKICYKLLYVIQGVKKIFDKQLLGLNRYQSFWSRTPFYNAASDWPRTFLHQGCFCLANHYFFGG